MKKPKQHTFHHEFKPISTPGIYSGIPLDRYHRADICDGVSVSSSGLRRLFTLSPAHFYAEWSGNPNAVEPEEKAHHVIGRAVHHLFLREIGAGAFTELFVDQPDEYPDRQTGVLKKWTYQAEYCRRWRSRQEKAGRSILTQTDLRNIRGMANSLAAHPIIEAGALNGQIERSIFWKDAATGIWIKSRPDAIPTTSVDFVDLKTTNSVLWPDIQRTIAECGYHQQGALICEGAKRVLGIDRPTFTLIFVEKKPPWCVRVVTLKDNDLARGAKQNRYALAVMARCLASGKWPGPGGDREDAEHIELPTWAQNQIDTKLEFGII